MADFFNNRIQKFDARGRISRNLWRTGEGPGELDRPTDVAVDEAGNLYVVDFGNHRIQKLAPAGEEP